MFCHSQKPRALFEVNQKIAREVLHRFKRKSKAPLPFIAWEFDLGLIKKHLSMDVTGGWFGNMMIKKVKTAGIFGEDVGSSAEWERYSKLGELTNLMVEIEIEDRRVTVSLSASGSIVLYSKMIESERLKAVDEILDLIIDLESRASQPKKN